jgi:iron complex outermembrane receptor protein
MQTTFRRGVSLLALALSATASFAQPAFAQGADDQTRSGEAAVVEEGITSIVVTAERRSENIQSSSLSISVLSAEALSAVDDARDIGALVPGVEITSGGVTLQSFVRGIGDFGSSSLNQTAVAYNVDGVYVANTAEVSPQFYDLQRIEVLKGPQGTLYGRNSSAGAINLIYNSPELGELSGNADAEIGNYDYHHLSGGINLPLGDVAAVRVSGNWLERDGYLSDGSDDDEQAAGRVQLLVEPSSDISVKVTGSLSHRGGAGPGAVPINIGLPKFTGPVDATANAIRLLNAPNDFTPGAGLPPATPFTQTGLLRDMFLDIDQQELHAEINANLDGTQITFIPSFRWSDSSVGTYASGAIFLNQEDIKQNSYELRLAREIGSLDLVVGAYYLDLSQLTAAQIFQSLIVSVDQVADVDTESYAFFGQGTLSVTPEFRLIAGARYTNEDRSIVAHAENTAILFGSVDVFDIDNSATFKKWSWRLGAEYDLTADNMIYVTASKGFKSGGFNIFEPTPTITNAYQPETLYSYVIGARNRFFDNTVQLNFEGFYWDYKDSQQNRLAVTPSGALQFSTFNAASATLYGVDVDLIVQPTSNDTFRAAVSYLHTEFDEFVFNTPFPSNPASNGCALDNVPPFSVDCSGFPLPRAPKWSGMAGYQHVFDLSSSGDVTLGGDMQFSSKRYIGGEYIDDEIAESYIRFNADLTYTTPSGNVSVSAFIRNIGNEQIARGANLRGGIVYAEVAPPRTYGLKVSTRF